MEVSRDEAEPSAAAVPGTGGGPSAASPAGVIVLMEMVASATTTADAAGNFSYPFNLDQEGLHTLKATGLQSGHVVTAQVVVHSETAGAGIDEAPGTRGGVDVLANTGPSSGVLIWGAAGLGLLPSARAA